MEGEEGSIEVRVTADHVVLKNGLHSLWCSRSDGRLHPGNEVSWEDDGNSERLKSAHGVIGKLKFFSDGEWKLLLISEARRVGKLPHGGTVFCIESITVVPLSEKLNPMDATGVDDMAWELVGQVVGGGGREKQKELRDREKLERRLTEALLRMFNESQSFYFCEGGGGDLTRSLQRQKHHQLHQQHSQQQQQQQQACDDDPGTPGWKQVDERFFWNKWMLSDLIDADNYESSRCDPWILPVIQGYVEIREIPMYFCGGSSHPISHRGGVSSERHGGKRGGGRQPDTNTDADGSEADGYESDVESGGSSDTDNMSNNWFENVSPSHGSSHGQKIQQEPAATANATEESPAVLSSSFPGTSSSSNAPATSAAVPTRTAHHDKDRDEVEAQLDEPLSSSSSWEVFPSLVPQFVLILISRRSKNRAGTRYRRRGVNTEGHVANYVETEMIVRVGDHIISYVIVRGSVPVFWTQPGYKYHPQPIITNDKKETQEAFSLHFEQQLNIYKELGIVNLVNQSGREKVISDTYKEHVYLLDNPLVSYIEFNFHHHCKRFQMHNVVLLLEGAQQLIKRFRFCWIATNNPNSTLCVQDGVFRVNCMDCLDRTNVIQSVFSKDVLQTVLHKLGILPFEEELSGELLQIYQEMWANNGDTISKQYTGTAAMKGDLTRYGERKIKGVMKDGYNSAHRYYQNLFRDTYRQVVIDLMQGVSPSEAFSSLPQSLRTLDEEGLTQEVEQGEEPWSLDREQDVADTIQLCREELFPTKSLRVQGWALEEPPGYSFVSDSLKAESCVMLQCREQEQLCIAHYSPSTRKVLCFIRLPMSSIEKIVIGHLATGMLSSSSKKRLHMRLHYSLDSSKGAPYFTFRVVNFTSIEEEREILLSIARTLAYIEPRISVVEQKLSKKKSLPHSGVIHLALPTNSAKVTEPMDIGPDSSSDKPVGISLTMTPVRSQFYLSPASGPSPSSPSPLPPSTSPELSRRPLVLMTAERRARLQSRSFESISSSINEELKSPTHARSIIRRSYSSDFDSGAGEEDMEDPEGEEGEEEEGEGEVFMSRRHIHHGGMRVHYSHQNSSSDVTDPSVVIDMSSGPVVSAVAAHEEGSSRLSRLKVRFLRQVKPSRRQVGSSELTSDGQSSSVGVEHHHNVAGSTARKHHGRGTAKEGDQPLLPFKESRSLFIYI